MTGFPQPTFSDPLDFATGLVAPLSGPWLSTAFGLSANRAFVIRLFATRQIVVSKIGFYLIVSAGSNDNCDVGIFDSTLSTKIGSSGSTANKLNATAPSIQSVALSSAVTLRQGSVYYLAFSCGTIGSTAAQLGGTNLNNGLVTLMGASAPNISQSFQSAAFPLPSSFTPGGTIANVPILAALI